MQWKPGIQWVFNFAVLGVIVFALIGAAWLFARAIEQGATFLGAVIAALATVVAVLLGRHHERKKEAQSVRRQQLGKIYEEIAAIMAGHERTSRANQKLMVQFMRKALTYAGPGVLKAFIEWRKQLPADDAADVGRGDMLRFETVMKEMRKDLGISNWMLQDGDLLRVAHTDFDVAFPESEPIAPPEPDGEEPRVTATTPAPSRKRSPHKA